MHGGKGNTERVCRVRKQLDALDLLASCVEVKVETLAGQQQEVTVRAWKKLDSTKMTRYRGENVPYLESGTIWSMVIE